VSGKHNNREDAAKSIYYVLGHGRAKATYAHPTLALEYARHLSHDLAVEVNDLFIRYKADAVGLALEILDEFAEQVEYDSMRVELRDLVAKHNKESAGAAQTAGVRNFEAYNGAGLRGLYGGMTKAEVVKHKGLPKGAHHLDHAGHEELAANYFKATQATAKLKREKISGQGEAEAAHEAVGKAVRQTIRGLGGTMPEDESTLDHINEARKRLKASDPKKLEKKS
jgi:DNA-damage-inducible protein D